MKNAKGFAAMIVVGGLGNPRFRYSMSRHLAEIKDAALKIDLSEFETYQLHKYSYATAAGTALDAACPVADAGDSSALAFAMTELGSFGEHG